MAPEAARGLQPSRVFGGDLQAPPGAFPREEAPSDAEAGALLLAHHRDQIPYLYTAMGLLSILLVAGILLFAPSQELRVPSLFAVIAAASGAGLGMLFLFRRPPPEAVYPTTFLLAMLHVAVALHFLRVFDNPSHAAYLALFSLVVAYFLTSRFWYLLFNAGVLAGWTLLALIAGGGNLWIQMTVLVVVGVLFATIAHHQRLASLANALLGRSRQEGQRQALEDTVAALENSEARYQLLSDVASEGVALVRAGRIVEVNRAFRRLFGCNDDEAVGADIDEFLATREEDSVSLQWAAIVPPGQELVAVNLPGGARRVFKTVERRLHEGPNALRVRRFQDVSAEAAAHEEMRASITRLRDAERIAQVGHFVRDLDTGASVWSEGIHRIIGIAPGSVEPGVQTLLGFVHPDDRAAVEQDITAVHEIGSSYHVSFRLQRPDGRERYVRVQAEVGYSADGKRRVVRGIAQDITESRGAEDKFRALLESTPDPLIICDHTGQIQLVNGEAERLFGYTRDELVGTPVSRLVADAKPGAGAQPSGAAAARPNPANPGAPRPERLGRRKDGTEFPVEISQAPMHTPDGDLVIAAVRDITQRRKAAQADRLAYERLLKIRQLKEIDRVKTTLLNTASHELNTPLTPLKLQVYLMRQGQLGKTSAKQDRALEILDRNLDRLSRLIQDVLDVARLQSGRLRLERTWEDITQLAAEAVDCFADQAAGHHVTLSLDADGPHQVAIDHDRITQVLYNLISNSLKVTAEGDHIDVVVRGDDDEVRIEVCDTGAGLSETQMSRLFQPFTQVHEQLPSAPSGTGLGLYISKGLVEQHGGRIWVESGGSGHGARFIFTLPLVPAVVQAEITSGDDEAAAADAAAEAEPTDAATME